MIDFVTLLLGLVLGPRQIELTVQDPVSSVEILLDGQRIERLESAPWTLEIDFGRDLVPHRLTAIAYDSQERPIGSAKQIVNYSRSSFEATLVLDPDSDAAARRGRVIWEGALRQPPSQIDLRFDSKPIAVGSEGGFTLPVYQPGSVHLLEATITFADGSIGLTTLTLGGDYLDKTSSTLTAVLLTSPAGEPWSRQQAQGWLVVRGRPVRVFAATAPPGRLIVLRDDSVERSIRAVVPSRDYLARPRYSTSANLDYDVVAIGARPLAEYPGTFSMSSPTSLRRRYGLRRILLHEGPLVPERKQRKQAREGQKLWDALAVAGLHAARANRPRAVLLMIGRRMTDQSRLDAAVACDYLQRIHVPLLIWAPDRQALERFGLTDTERAFFGAEGIFQVEIEIGREIESQTVLWLEGEYLPNEVSVSSTAPKGVDFPH